MKNLFLITAALLIFGSCKKSDNNSSAPLDADSFRFGITGGLCGSCYHYYEMRNGSIYEDSVMGPNGWIFKTIAMPGSKYAVAAPLLNSFPTSLSLNPNATYGCNGCADQQVFMIEAINQGVKSYWYIDDVPSTIPVAVKPYTDQMRNVIQQLQ